MRCVAAQFCELDPTVDELPERTGLVRFRTWLKAQDFERYLAAEVASALAAVGLRGTSVDSTLIAASGSTQNKAAKSGSGDVEYAPG